MIEVGRDVLILFVSISFFFLTRKWGRVEGCAEFVF